MRYLLFTLCLAAYGQHTVNTSQDYKGVQDFSAVTRMMPVIKAADPATCSPGEFYFNSASATFRYCSATNIWAALGGGTGSESTSVSNTGTGAAVLKAASNVAARKIAGAGGITVTENVDDITVAPTLLTTKGDLFTFGTVNARLAVGATTGHVLTINPATATGLEWAASTGGAGGASLAADGPGIWFPFGNPQTQVAGGTQTALRTYIHSFVLPFTMSVDAIGFRVQTAAASGASGLTVGIYNSACDTLLASGNKSSGLNVSGYYSVTFADTSLTPGVYHLAWTTDDTTMQMSSTGMAAVATGFGTLAATLQYFYGTASSGTGATLTLPASCGTRSSVAATVSLAHFALIP